MDNGISADLFDNVELFTELGGKERDELLALMDVSHFATSGVLFTANSPRENLYIVQDGQVALSVTAPSGLDKRTILFGKYDLLGERALIDDAPHSTTATALADTTVVKISRARLLAVLEANPAMASRIFVRIARLIARRMDQTATAVSDEDARLVSGRTREEHDLLGTRAVPYEAYYGIQTFRARQNFHITGVPLSHYPQLIRALAMVKMSAAMANRDAGLLPRDKAGAIVEACSEILDGKWHSQFVVDVLQGGAGTSTNMNANEVIANRALEILGHERGEYEYCHPNNHVNCSQSTNDVYPTAVKLAMFNSNKAMIRALQELIAALHEKGKEFAGILKMGRTQLQDAVPMTLGQEFDAYAVSLAEEVERLRENARLLLEVNLGGTAIGTGINAPAAYAIRVVSYLRKITGLDVVLAPNLVEATQDTGAFVMFSSALKRLAVKLSKVCNDLRLLSSGPRAGLNEIDLPQMQPGSTIMPGKVNPVIPEVVNQIAYKVIGNDLTVTLGAEAGQLELNVMEPVIAQSIFESIGILTNGIITLRHRCIAGIVGNADRCREYVERSIGVVTALSPVLGYEACTGLAKEALEKNRGIYELVLEKELLPKDKLDELLAPERMIGGQRAAR